MPIIGLLDACGECCNPTGTCRTIYLWRYLPGFAGFAIENSGPSGVPGPVNGGTGDPIQFYYGAIYNEMSFLITHADGTVVGDGFCAFGASPNFAPSAGGPSPPFASMQIFCDGWKAVPLESDGVTTQTLFSNTELKWSTNQDIALDTPQDVAARASTVATDITGLASQFTDLAFGDQYSFTNSGTPTAATFSYNDSCALTGFCGAPGTEVATDFEYDLTGIDTSTGYDNAITSTIGYGTNGLPDDPFAQDPPSFGGSLIGGTASPSSFFIVVAKGSTIQAVGIQGGCYICAAMSQGLITGPYCFKTYIVYDASTPDPGTSGPNIVFESCAPGGTGDGVTPIDIPVPTHSGIASGFWPTTPIALTNTSAPMGRVTFLEAGSC